MLLATSPRILYRGIDTHPKCYTYITIEVTPINKHYR